MVCAPITASRTWPNALSKFIAASYEQVSLPYFLTIDLDCCRRCGFDFCRVAQTGRHSFAKSRAETKGCIVANGIAAWMAVVDGDSGSFRVLPTLPNITAALCLRTDSSAARHCRIEFVQPRTAFCLCCTGKLADCLSGLQNPARS